MAGWTTYPSNADGGAIFTPRAMTDGEVDSFIAAPREVDDLDDEDGSDLKVIGAKWVLWPIIALLLWLVNKGRTLVNAAGGFVLLNGGGYVPKLGLVGTATNDSAAAGNVGEHIRTLVAVGAEVALTTATPATVGGVTLTAGDWDVEGSVNFDLNAATLTASAAGINTSVAIPTDGTEVNSGLQTTALTLKNALTVPRVRLSLATTTTVRLVAVATYSAGNIFGYGAISARRVR